LGLLLRVREGKERKGGKGIGGREELGGEENGKGGPGRTPPTFLTD